MSRIWSVFSLMRTIDEQLDPAVAQVIILGPAGDLFDRSMQQASDGLSLLPSLAGLIKCIALETERKLYLVQCDNNIDQNALLKLRGFLKEANLASGEYRITGNDLYGLQPVIDIVDSAVITPAGEHSIKAEHILSLGGARGIVSQVLERIGSPHTKLTLVGSTSLDHEDVQMLDLNENQLQDRLLKSLTQAEGKLPTPVQLQRAVQLVERTGTVRATLERLRECYAEVEYVCLDLSQTADLERLAALPGWNEADLVINGTGTIKDASFRRKDRGSFDQVLAVKILPALLFLQIGPGRAVKRMLSFTSIASKSGNLGQTDYAAANEFVNACSWWLARHYDQVTVRSINWGPWGGGTGMASPQVLERFRKQGIEAIELTEAMRLISSSFSISHPVEIAGLSFTREHLRILLERQWCIQRSSFWRHHVLPGEFGDDNNTLAIAFHEAIPYLQGHRKRGTSVVPAACMLMFGYEQVRATLGEMPPLPLVLSCYVYGGITVPTGVIKRIECSQWCQQETHYLNVRDSTGRRLLYDVRVRFAGTYLPPPLPLHDEFPYDRKVALKDVYELALFHSGLFKVLTSDIRYCSRSSRLEAKARATPTIALLGRTDYESVDFDPILIDAILQCILVVVGENHGVSALPQRLKTVLYKPIEAGKEYTIRARINSINPDSSASIEGVCYDSEGVLALQLLTSKLTITPHLLDHAPPIGSALQD